MMECLVRLLPVNSQAKYWARYFRATRSHTSHWRIEAYKALRNSAKIPFGEAAALIDKHAPK